VIRPIQYLRALAALSVVWLHVLLNMPGVTEKLGASRFYSSGVDLFFVISGFIMLVTTHGKQVTSAQFFRLRVIRVAPMYWIWTTVLAICLVGGIVSSKAGLAPTVLLQSYLFIPKSAPVLFPGWTLNYEMFFYAIFALSLAPSSRLQLPSFLTVIGLLVAAGYVLKPANPILQTYTSPLLLEFAAGSVTGYLWVRDKLKIGSAVSLLAIGVGFFLLFRWGLAPLFGKTQLLGAILVVIGCLQPALSRLQNRLFLALGDASYSIYLTHPFTIMLLRAAWAQHSSQLSFASASTFMALAVLLSAAAGLGLYRWVERPLTAWLRSALGGTARPSSLRPNLAPETSQ